jgi:hypothetical protein
MFKPMTLTTSLSLPAVGDFPVVRPTSVTPQIPLKMSAEMRGIVFSAAYLREVVQATREMPKALPPPVLDMLLYVSFCNSDFSMMVIKFIMVSGCFSDFSLLIISIIIRDF